jgi:hypothetical protein
VAELLATFLKPSFSSPRSCSGVTYRDHHIAEEVTAFSMTQLDPVTHRQLLLPASYSLAT